MHDALTQLRIFGRPELKVLHKILKRGESVNHCIYGFYQAGSGLLVATNERVMFIDKRPFFLNIEEIRYGIIRDISVKFNYLTAQISVNGGLKRLDFRTVSDARLRELSTYIDSKINEYIADPVATFTSDSVATVLQSRRKTLLPRPRASKFNSLSYISNR